MAWADYAPDTPAVNAVMRSGKGDTQPPARSDSAAEGQPLGPPVWRQSGVTAQRFTGLTERPNFRNRALPSTNV